MTNAAMVQSQHIAVRRRTLPCLNRVWDGYTFSAVNIGYQNWKKRNLSTSKNLLNHYIRMAEQWKTCQSVWDSHGDVCSNTDWKFWGRHEFFRPGCGWTMLAAESFGGSQGHMGRQGMDSMMCFGGQTEIIYVERFVLAILVIVHSHQFQISNVTQSHYYRCHLLARSFCWLSFWSSGRKFPWMSLSRTSAHTCRG